MVLSVMAVSIIHVHVHCIWQLLIGYLRMIITILKNVKSSQCICLSNFDDPLPPLSMSMPLEVQLLLASLLHEPMSSIHTMYIVYKHCLLS